MWPFKNKQQSFNEEKLKQQISAQLIFDPVTKQLKIKPKEPEPPTSVPEPEPKVKLECPTCKKALEKYSVNRFKCPHCRNWIYYRDHTLFTMEEYHRRREEYYRRRHEEWLQEQLTEDLGKLGLTEEKFKQREQELQAMSKVPIKRASVIMSLFNESILKIKDPDTQEQRYQDLAIIMNRSGEDVFHILKAGAKARLAALKKEGYGRVSILSSQMCPACKKVDGKVLTIAEARETMPIPIKECKNRPYHDNYSFCTCIYEGEFDDEYFEKQERKR